MNAKTAEDVQSTEEIRHVNTEIRDVNAELSYSAAIAIDAILDGGGRSYEHWSSTVFSYLK